jgi:hypothetical protein
MKLFGIEIRRVPPEQPTPFERLIHACDEMNSAWEDLRKEGMVRARPWVIWEESRVVISEWSGKPTIVHE